MKKLSKNDVKTAVRLGLLAGTSICGFVLTYRDVWIGMGLPNEWWAEPAVYLLGIASGIGLFRWIGRS